MFKTTETLRKVDLLDKAKAAREERALLRQKEAAVTTIQALVRGFLCRKRFTRSLLKDIDELLGHNCDLTSNNATSKLQLHPAVDVFQAIKKFLYVYKEDRDKQRFELLCRYILTCMESEKDAKVWYICLALNKDLVLPWLRQLKDMLTLCCGKLKQLKPDSPTDAKLVTLYLHMMVTFSDTATWKIFKMPGGEALRPSMNQLCANVMGHLNTIGLYPMLQSLLLQGLARKKPGFTHTIFSAIFTLALRPLVASKFTSNLLSLFLSYILPTPAIILHLSSITPEHITTMQSHQMLRKCLLFMSDHRNKGALFKVIKPSGALCLLGNLTHLGYLEHEILSANISTFTNSVNTLLAHCCQLNTSNNKKKCNAAQWHPVLGWFNHSIDPRLHDCMNFIVQQLSMLWGQTIMNAVFITTLKIVQPDEITKPQSTNPNDNKLASKGGNFLRRLQRSTSRLGGQRGGKSLSSPDVLAVCRVCEMYQMTLATMTELRRDILTGLSYRDILLPRLWRFIAELGSHGGLKVFLEYLNAGVESQPIFSVLVLFCDVAGYLIAIVDDVEFYEHQVPFHPEDLIAVTSFLNSFVFKMIWDKPEEIQACKIGEGNQKYKDLFTSTHNLLMLLYERDCRRSFSPANHWLIRDVKQSSLRGELEKGTKKSRLILQLIPHIIPHKERVILFRRKVQEEKRSLGLTESAMASPHSTLISIHRSRLVEDGYQQLAPLSPNILKGLVRVKFINEQGLDEAGIDQDGVFKEFLEETISMVFNPSLNLFKTTSEQRLYPSSSSFITENHLQLFEFVGKMLGKAVYEGIVVEVPFASFFLSQMLDHQHNQLYSPIDELPSLDPELYKNLTYVKHYEGDISDLDLVFSYDEDIMGKLVTHELVSGGKAVAVTNENRIKYIHLMAHFRMCAQIKEQTKAFKRGFLSIVNHEWLSWFSGPQLQRLISGDNTAMDLTDLRKHTQYYGGFHNSHRVINWLFDVLANDFSPQERGLFLKFVTSCSKPPLLGFAHLEPPFSIRCVEVSDDQDTGDTVGSVLRGFLRIQKKDPVGRLPTSSTCFNLLKLPNYQKKSTLREKLRYSITSNTGFELS